MNFIRILTALLFCAITTVSYMLGCTDESNNPCQPCLTTNDTASATTETAFTTNDTTLATNETVSTTNNTTLVTNETTSTTNDTTLVTNETASATNGSVDFVPYWEPGSQWIGNTEAQDAMNSFLNQFEATLKTGGTWNSTIEVYFTDDETSAYASANQSSPTDTTLDGMVYLASNMWQQIVNGVDDPNGLIDPNTGENADVKINWNFALSAPSSNIGLLRHEMMHGLGMLSSIYWAEWPLGGSIVKPGVNEVSIRTVYDKHLYDLNGNPLLGSYNSTTHEFILNDYTVDSDWGDGNGAGVVYRGISDAGGIMDMYLSSGNPDPSWGSGGIDTSHVAIVMYAGIHPTWHTVEEVDRAFLRGMGYTVVIP